MIVLDWISTFCLNAATSTLEAQWSNRYIVIWGVTYRFCINCDQRNLYITLWYCNVFHKCCTTITTISSDQNDFSESTRTLLKSLHITFIMVSTTVHHSSILAEDTVSPYVVVTKGRWNSSTLDAICAQKTPHFPNSSLGRSLAFILI